MLYSTVRDVAQIHEAYSLKDRLFAAKEAKRLESTDLPSFYAIDVDGSTISHIKIWTYLRWRFAHQVSCHRVERPVRIDVKGKRAIVEVQLVDDFSVKTKKSGIQHHVDRAHGWSQWEKTSSDWKQASVRFVQNSSR